MSKPAPTLMAPYVRGTLALVINIGILVLVYISMTTGGVGLKAIPGELWITVGLINGFYFGSPKG